MGCPRRSPPTAPPLQVKSFNISWDALNTEIDESRVLYMLEVEELMIPEPQKATCQPSDTFPGAHLPKECRYNVTKQETFQTLQTSIVHGVLEKKLLYKFAVKVNTPYGASNWSTSVFKHLKDDWNTRKSARLLKAMRDMRINISNPIPREGIIKDLSEIQFIGQGRVNTYILKRLFNYAITQCINLTN